ncbi:hypothetical protein F4861DRAFT_550166 [Xylaria intraflava]|nr:hypothetical protein F4861DRAFT_550166 [Xylaria intraflava]
MAHETKAFDLTPGERQDTLGEIKALLLQVSAQIALADVAQATKDDVKYTDALFKVDHALILANDDDACDTARAPLATCHNYRGQVLVALERRQEAYDAFKQATTVGARALTDAPAARDASRRMLELEQKFGINDLEQQGNSGDGQGRKAQGTGNTISSDQAGVALGDHADDNPHHRDEAPQRRLDQEMSRFPQVHSGSARRRTVVVESDGEINMISPTEVRRLG